MDSDVPNGFTRATQGLGVPVPFANEMRSMIGDKVVRVTLLYYHVLQLWANIIIRDIQCYYANVTVKCYTVRLAYLEAPQMERAERKTSTSA